MTSMTLYDYFRSSAAYRVRIALNIKGLDYAQVPVNLAMGEHATESFHRVNAQGLVPILVDADFTLAQSLAICEYLEETHAEPPLLPQGAAARARVRNLALAVACDIHPLNNLRVLNYLTSNLGIDEQRKLIWYRHWVEVGFSSMEQQLADDDVSGEFCHGDRPGLADCCLVPQVFNARRFQVDLTAYPNIVRIDAACNALASFAQAHPEKQPGAV